RRLGESLPPPGPESPDALDSEADLLNPGADARAWLAAQIDTPAAALAQADGPRLAAAMERLAQRLRTSLTRPKPREALTSSPDRRTKAT
ncbi:MAG: hypothetical protein J0M20_10170, partial [Burkholderiales bacterium]|nr:hypothetical protein [Burkholderiales bacterium]